MAVSAALGIPFDYISLQFHLFPTSGNACLGMGIVVTPDGKFVYALNTLASNRYSFEFEAPVALPTAAAQVTLTIGNDTGTITPRVVSN